MTDLIDQIDVDTMAADLGMTVAQVRKALREAVAAGFLAVESIHPDVVILQGLIPEKQCPRCERTKPLTDFNRATKARDGRQTYCAPCQVDHWRDWYRTRRTTKGLEDE